MVVLGAGPGGYAAAFYAADLGYEVMLVDPRANPGGVCLFEGCIPSKTLLHGAALIHEVTSSKNIGLEFGSLRLDLDKLRAHKESVVNKLTSGLGLLSKQRDIIYKLGKGQFIDPHNLIISTDEGEERTSFDYAIIATGSIPRKLPFLPTEHPLVWDSTKALELKEVPESLLVIGGGYIGLELGTVYQALGAEVAVAEMAEQLLPMVDGDLVEPLIKSMHERMNRIYTGAKIQDVQFTENKASVKIQLSDGKEAVEHFDRVLVSVGRKPQTEGLGLENLNLTLSEQGFILTNGRQQTDYQHIYAIGDVAGEPMLAHVASYEAHIAVDNIHGEESVYDARAIPAVVFTDPELAWCGLTERDARRLNLAVEVMRFPWNASGRALSMNRTDGLTKMIFDKKTHRVLGVGIVGHGAGELISEGVLAIEMGAFAEDIKMTIHPHPTISETVMESAEMLFGTSTHLYRPRKN